MSLVDSLKALQAVRDEEIVITTMGAAREWQKLSQHALDFVLVPSSMGQASSLGLGMALGAAGSKSRCLQRRRFDVDESRLAGDDRPLRVPRT